MSVIATAFRSEGIKKQGRPEIALGSPTIGNLIASGRGLFATCEVCLHSARLDLPDLATRYGAGHSCAQAALRPILQCSVCGSIEASLQESRSPRHGAERPRLSRHIPDYV